MASKGRVPPPHHRRPLPGPGVVHPDAYASSVHPPVGGFPHFERLPPHEVMAHKLSSQHIEIEKLATENQRLAATHGTLRQDLATAKHELQLIHSHVADVKTDKEQQIRGIMDKISMMESELEAAETIKKDLQQARSEAQALAAGRQELISKAQQLSRELQMVHSEAQQIPPLMAELDGLRQEYQHCRGTYDYEKKLCNDHLESLQVMEKNYVTMSREVEKLRAELSNSTNAYTNPGGQYGGSAGYNGSVPFGTYPPGQAYGVQPGHASHLGGVSGGTEGNSPHVPYGSRGPLYTAYRGTSYDPHRVVQPGASYDAQWGAAASTHNTPGAAGYEAQRGQRSEAQKGPGFEAHRVSGDEAQRGANYDAQKGATYDASSRATAGPQLNNPYPPTPVGTGYESAARGANPVHR